MQQNNNQLQPTSSYGGGNNNRQENILDTKPAIIVLREDLIFMSFHQLKDLMQNKQNN